MRTRSLAVPVQRALSLYLPGNDLMLHVAVGTEAEGARQMLFNQLERLRRGDVLILGPVLSALQRRLALLLRQTNLSGNTLGLNSDQILVSRWDPESTDEIDPS